MYCGSVFGSLVIVIVAAIGRDITERNNNARKNVDSKNPDSLCEPMIPELIFKTSLQIRYSNLLSYLCKNTNMCLSIG
jgi:hypothetical protein